VSENIILDWSGTVVDDLGPVLDATNQIFRDFGRTELSREEFRRHFRLPFSEFYAELLPEATMEGLEELYHRFFVNLQDHVTLLPGALDFLEFCRQTGRRVFLLSTIRADHFERQAANLGVMPYFEHAYVGVRDKRERIHAILRERELDPRHTLFAGDMVHDVETARHGGVLSVAVLSGFDPPDKLAAARPDVTLNSLADLHRLLDARKVFPAGGPVSTVGALVFHPSEEKVLLVRTTKWSGLWGIAGGKIRRGENAEDALRRETLEETGLELDDVNFVFCQDCIDSQEFHRPAHFLLLNYTARARSSEVRLNHEAVEHRWVTPAEALEFPLNSPTRLLIQRVLEK
jgi:phosphoglycolate phosphatase